MDNNPTDKIINKNKASRLLRLAFKGRYSSKCVTVKVHVCIRVSCSYSIFFVTGKYIQLVMDRRRAHGNLLLSFPVPLEVSAEDDTWLRVFGCESSEVSNDRSKQ